jgi:antibiotic biosynthesis monooxygenase (ABM) superfamily enzyme
MPTLIVFHEVDDVDHWLASPKRKEYFGPAA